MKKTFFRLRSAVRKRTLSPEGKLGWTSHLCIEKKGGKTFLCAFPGLNKHCMGDIEASLAFRRQRRVGRRATKSCALLSLRKQHSPRPVKPSAHEDRGRGYGGTSREAESGKLSHSSLRDFPQTSISTLPSHVNPSLQASATTPAWRSRRARASTSPCPPWARSSRRCRARSRDTCHTGSQSSPGCCR